MLLELACNCTFCYLQIFLNEYSCVIPLFPVGLGEGLTSLQHQLLTVSISIQHCIVSSVLQK